MKSKLTYLIPIVLLVVVALTVLKSVRIIAGLASGLINLFFGIVVVIALVLIVLWMFSYAKKNK